MTNQITPPGLLTTTLAPADGIFLREVRKFLNIYGVCETSVVKGPRKSAKPALDGFPAPIRCSPSPFPEYPSGSFVCPREGQGQAPKKEGSSKKRDTGRPSLGRILFRVMPFSLPLPFPGFLTSQGSGDQGEAPAAGAGRCILVTYAGSSRPRGRDGITNRYGGDCLPCTAGGEKEPPPVLLVNGICPAM